MRPEKGEELATECRRRRKARRVDVQIATAITIFTILLVGTGFALFGLNVSILLRDPAALAGQPPFLGALSQLGAAGWAVGAAISLFTGFQLHRRDRDRSQAWFLIAAGALTAMLGFDDLFMIHEEAGPRYLGINEKVWFAAYAAAALALVLRFAACLKRSPLLAVAAAGTMAFSVAQDIAVEIATSLELIRMSHRADIVQLGLEDGAKLLGILLWAAFLIRQSSWALGCLERDEGRVSLPLPQDPGPGCNGPPGLRGTRP